VDWGDNSSISFADIDKDGDLDAFIGGSKGTIGYYRNTNGSFVQVTGAANPFDAVTLATMAPSFADIDNDGDLDAFITTVTSMENSTGSIAFYRNTNASFAQVTGAANPFNGMTVSSSLRPSFADIDKDGDLDIFIGDGKGSMAYYRNTNGSFSRQSGTANPMNNISGLDANSNVTFADIDGDGDLDAIIGQQDGTLKYLENK
jgi:FG-GAP-like repeat